MKAKCLRGVSRRKFVVTTETDPRARPASDLVDRNFYADAPNVLWVADITYVPTWAGFLYLAVVLDAFSRRIIGWAMGNDQKAQLVIDAMNRAYARSEVHACCLLGCPLLSNREVRCNRHATYTAKDGLLI